MKGIGGNREPGGQKATSVSEREAQPQRLGDGRAFHAVKRGESPATLVTRYPDMSAGIAKEPLERRAAAVRLWLEDQGVLAVGAPFSGLVGQSIPLPSEGELAAHFRAKDKLGMLPDARAGDASAQRRHATARVIRGDGPTVERGLQPSSVGVSARSPQTRRVPARTAGKPAAQTPGEVPARSADQKPTPARTADEKPTPARTARRTPARAQAEQADKTLRPHSGQASKATNAARPELSQMMMKAGVPKDQLDAIAGFVADRNIPTDSLCDIIRAGKYQGGELAVALQVAALVEDATHNRLIDAQRRDEMQAHVIPNLKKGNINFGTNKGGQGHAGYDPVANEIRLPEGGVDLGSLKARAYAIHELQHVVQDMDQRHGSRYQFEQDGHATFAEYMLRSKELIVEKADGTLETDIKQAHEFLPKLLRFDGPDRHAIQTRLAEAVAAQTDNPDAKLSDDERDIASTILPPEETFAANYHRNASSNLRMLWDPVKERQRTPAELDDFLSAEDTKDGLRKKEETP